MEKFEKDGLIAVLYSPEYGAGWSSWYYYDATPEDESLIPEREAILCMDSQIVKAFIEDGWASAADVASTLVPGLYIGGAHNLQIRWVDKGMWFWIEEYDGWEDLIVSSHDHADNTDPDYNFMQA